MPETTVFDSYESELAALEAQGQRRRCRVVEPLEAPWALVEGRRALHFSSNDYLGLSQDPRLKQAAIEATERYGTGSGSSRLIAGTNPLVEALETDLATFKGTEAALVLATGYQANVAILQAMLEPGDQVFADKLNHASLVDGCRLSGAMLVRYRHLDFNHLESKLRQAPATGRRWIVTDSVFSMDGDAPDLAALMDLAERYGAFTLIDEAHATGLYGEKGGGLCEQFGVSHRVTLQMGTFSKALGGQGAYVAGSRVMIDTLINKARGLIYSTAPAPATLAAAHAALQVIQTDPAPRRRLEANIAHFSQLLERPLSGPIVPVILGDSATALEASRQLLDAGFFVQAIRPPTVPPRTARLRITLTAAHQPEHLDAFAETLPQIV